MHGLNKCTTYFFVFYFIQFIVNTHNSGTAANQTHVYMTHVSELPLESDPAVLTLSTGTSYRMRSSAVLIPKSAVRPNMSQFIPVYILNNHLLKVIINININISSYPILGYTSVLSNWFSHQTYYKFLLSQKIITSFKYTKNIQFTQPLSVSLSLNPSMVQKLLWYLKYLQFMFYSHNKTYSTAMWNKN
jgi:hypothetical protein